MRRYRASVRQRVDGAFVPRFRLDNFGEWIKHKDYGDLIWRALKLAMYMEAGVYDKHYKGVLADFLSAARFVRERERNDV